MDESSDDFEIIRDWELVNDGEDSECHEGENEPCLFKLVLKSNEQLGKDKDNLGNLDERFAVDEEDDEKTVLTKFHLAVGCKKLRDIERMSRQRVQADDAQLPPDPDDRCESDISGADDDTDLSSFSPGTLDVSLLDGSRRVVRTYTHEPNQTLDNFLTCLAIIALFFAFGAGIGHYVGTDREVFLRRLQAERVKSLEEEFKLCFKHASELQSKLEGITNHFDLQHLQPPTDTNDSMPSTERTSGSDHASISMSVEGNSALFVHLEYEGTLYGNAKHFYQNSLDEGGRGEVLRKDIHDSNVRLKENTPTGIDRRNMISESERKLKTYPENVTQSKRKSNNKESDLVAKRLMSELHRLLGSLTENSFYSLSHDDVKAHSKEFSHLFHKLNTNKHHKHFSGDDNGNEVNNNFLWSSCQKGWWKLLKEIYYKKFTSLKKHKKDVFSKLKMNKCAHFYEIWQLHVACDVLHSRRDIFKSGSRGSDEELNKIMYQNTALNLYSDELCSEISVFLSAGCKYFDCMHCQLGKKKCANNRNKIHIQ